MSPGGSSERMAFLRREIARVERGGGSTGDARMQRLPAPVGEASLSTLLSPRRLAASLHEIVPATAPDAFAALGFAMHLCALCARDRPHAGIVWAIEDFVASEMGAPYGPGLAEAGVDVANLAIVRTQGPRETLRAMEDALKCKGVAAVVAESSLTPRLYGLDVSRRLTLAARAGGAAGFLTPVAMAGLAETLSSAAATRVEITRHCSAVEAFNRSRLGLPGPPVLGVRILKARGMFGLDAARVHEVAYHAFSVDPFSLSADRPDPASGFFARSA